MEKMNKAQAGYHILMILSSVDGNTDSREEAVIVDFIKSNFPTTINKKEEKLKHLQRKPEDYAICFNKAMEDFYMDSTEHERVLFLNFAVQLVKADSKITHEENYFLAQLFDSWEVQTEE
jgi:uncharacterized tellurite resistance protein B-like protein